MWRVDGDMKCTVHDLEVMGSNPSWVELRVRSTSLQVVLEPKIQPFYGIEFVHEDIVI